MLTGELEDLSFELCKALTGVCVCVRALEVILKVCERACSLFVLDALFPQKVVN